MEDHIKFDAALTPADHIVLQSLKRDIETVRQRKNLAAKKETRDLKLTATIDSSNDQLSQEDLTGVETIRKATDPASETFQPTVFVSSDGLPEHWPAVLVHHVVKPYVRLARKVVRHETDVVMLTHLILYFTTSVPSAFFLYRSFSYWRGWLHLVMQCYYVGTYTLMMHQHIHQRGILSTRFAIIDRLFPYVTDPLMGHTWNSYFYHHVKHHHVEGNGPNDLSSTIRYQRDSIWDFIQYVGRFYFFVWLDLPLYFLRKNRPTMAVRAASWEFLTHFFYYLMIVYVDARATLFVFLLPLMLMRLGLMVGNWGQHAFVDDVEPDSDFRSSITLIDVASNRFCFNDGYHTSHHLNPLRHWRDHPASLLEQKLTYAKEGALIFHDIDFIMITVRLMMKDYESLSRCMVPIGRQIRMSLDERAELLRRLTRRFSEEDIEQKFKTRS